jgi:Tol biopolymer transport system component
MLTRQVFAMRGLKMLFCGFLLPALLLGCEDGEIAQPEEDNGPVHRIIFAAKDPQGVYGLYTTNHDGTDLKVVFPNAKSISDLWVSRNGDRVVCVVDKSMSPYSNDQLLVLDLEGRSATQITSLGGALLEEPQWFPNDEEILFGYFGSWRGAQFFRIRADGSDMTRITTDDNTSHRFPRLSPNGQKIAFENRNSASAIWVMNVDETSQLPLSVPGENAYLCGWTSDGGVLYFANNETYQNPGLWIIEDDGTNRRYLVGEGGTADVSRIDSKIALGSYHGIFAINPDGSDFKRIAANAVEGYPILWSNDGTKIAFRGDVNRDGKYGLCVVHADGSGAREIVGPSLEITNAPARAFDWVP